MAHTLSRSVLLDTSADDMWEAIKHSDKILCDLLPGVFAKAEYVQGHGEPGSIRLITMGPAISNGGQVKERVDKLDDTTRTYGYTILEGDSYYSSFSAELQFVPHGTTAEAVWTAKYDPVKDVDAEGHIETTATMVLTALERAVRFRKTFKHVETLQASPEAIWEAGKHADEILCKALPDYFDSTTMVHGHGGPGSIRVIKMGPAIPYAREVTERVDLVDEANKKLGYTVLKGDTRYKHFTATTQLSPGPSEGTTSAEWVATYVPDGDMGPPEHIKAVVVQVWKAFADAARASSQ